MKPLIDKTLILGHRGACGHAPENTMEAFELAIKMGADGVELDVHFTADGEVVVLHDEKIDRTSNGQGLVNQYTLAELKTMDFGYHFYKEQRKGIRIPTLAEVYELLAPIGKLVNVEIKSADPDIVKACHDIAKAYKMEENVIYSSFDHFQLQRAKEIIPNAFIAPLYGFNMLNPWNYCLDIGAKAVHPRFNQLRLLPDYVKNCHDRGIRIHTWTVNTEEDIAFLLEAGVDAIITNYPDIANDLRK
ncbi:MAG: glycerophosphodiester phosphodiesterase [Clostridia bacterium]|nr:glycerophosphodiester phosphodiesterase [Clostridia bacterium]